MVWLCQKPEGDSESEGKGSNQMVLVLVEFQSSPDPIMPVRLASYLSLLYEQAHREGQWNAPGLPKALPVILYHGLPPWRNALQMAELWSTAYPELESAQLQLKPIRV